MSKRELCTKCKYPIQTCVCDYLTTTCHQTRLVVLQHPSELKQAKNTVRLLTQISDNVTVYVGESESDFKAAKQAIEQTQSFLLFPGPESQVLLRDNVKGAESSQLILIDGTWKKAKKILALNPWLLALPQVKLADNPSSTYGIRQTKVSEGLSTIEAAALALHSVEGVDPTPFLRALEGLKYNFTKLMPDAVKQRYQ